MTNLPALREVGFSANRRLLGVQRLSHNPIRAAEAFTAVHEPITTGTGQSIAGLRLGDRRAHALLQALLVFRLLIRPDSATVTYASCSPDCSTRPRTRSAPARSATTYAACAPRLIIRIPGTHRYQLTETGGDRAMLLTHLHTRLLQPGLAHLTDPDPPTPSTLRTAATAYRRALDQLTQSRGDAKSQSQFRVHACGWLARRWTCDNSPGRPGRAPHSHRTRPSTARIGVIWPRALIQFGRQVTTSWGGGGEPTARLSRQPK